MNCLISIHPATICFERRDAGFFLKHNIRLLGKQFFNRGTTMTFKFVC